MVKTQETSKAAALGVKSPANKEKRALRYRSTCPAKLLERIARAYTQRLYLIEQEPMDEHSTSCALSVLGSTGNVYTVTLAHIPTCNCPDFQKKQDCCKHLLFVLLKVVGLPRSNPLVFQRAYLSSELEHLFGLLSNRQVGGRSGVLANTSVRQTFAQLKTGSPVKPTTTTSNERRRSLDENNDCPICFDPMSNKERLTFCQYGCGANFHTDCMTRWCRSAQMSCPLCRCPWSSQPGNVAASPIQNEGYVNLGRLQGQSPIRDTSTYQFSEWNYRSRYNRRWY